MKSASCSRSFEVEAMRDGRLAGAERASFERHMSTCSACAREAHALEALAERFRASDEASLDELHVRREKNRLLAAFDGALVPEERGFQWGRLVWPAAALALGAGAVVFVIWRGRPTPQLAVPATKSVIVADATAQYSRQPSEGTREKIVLRRGSLRIQVTHTAGQNGVLVELPDGELEDTGTTFTVIAADGHTTRVSVEEGSVVLRLEGHAPVVLGAGETWSKEAAPAPIASSTPEPVKERPSPPPPVRSAQPPPAPAPDPSDDFRAAMAAFDEGNSRDAATRFATFLEKHPHDPRAEDAAYLRVFALQRCGDKAAMKDAATEYLRLYPAGFRRSEVENLSR